MARQRGVALVNWEVRIISFLRAETGSKDAEHTSRLILLQETLTDYMRDQLL